MASEGYRHSQSPTQQQHCSHCPLRRHCHHCPLHNPHFAKPYLTPLPHFASFPLQTEPPQLPISSDARISQELERTELGGEEEDDEPVFVLTDGWREFFAKSEARRKLEKKQAKNGKK
ncbi:hypothetical protein Fmac_028268 [Flemingia macrophylla]|uniref:Uncharacterized protein n=1 Tax=Flemingia macrophylla TaxID=520843 RepID=A0ABD1L701_9FABA